MYASFLSPHLPPLQAKLQADLAALPSNPNPEEAESPDDQSRRVAHEARLVTLQQAQAGLSEAVTSAERALEAAEAKVAEEAKGLHAEEAKLEEASAKANRLHANAEASAAEHAGKVSRPHPIMHDP